MQPPFFGAAYTLVATTELVSFGFSIDAFILVVCITAAGAAIGKLVIYCGVKGFKRQLARNKNVQLFSRWLQDRRFLVAVFVTAVIPMLPLDDYIYIGAGAAKVRLTPMLSITIAAKLVKSAFEIGLEYLGILGTAIFEKHFLGLSHFDFSILLMIVMMIIGVFLFKYDWGRFLGGSLVDGVTG
ncbi:MAG: VTT domain-containing protein [Nitrososphaerales archaeon]